MAAIKEIRTLVLYFAFLLLFSNNVTCEDSLIIQTVLEYLNSNPNRVYDYTRGQLVDVQFKVCKNLEDRNFCDLLTKSILCMCYFDILCDLCYH